MSEEFLCDVFKPERRIFSLIYLLTWGRLCQGCLLGVHNCSHQLIVLIDLNIIQVHLIRLLLLVFNPLFALIVLVLIDTETCPEACKKISLGIIQTRNVVLLPSKVWGRSWQVCQFCDFNFHYQLLGLYQGNHIKFNLVIVVYISSLVSFSS